jgi:hypothetical protein
MLLWLVSSTRTVLSNTGGRKLKAIAQELFGNVFAMESVNHRPNYDWTRYNQTAMTKLMPMMMMMMMMMTGCIKRHRNRRLNQHETMHLYIAMSIHEYVSSTQ